jgi:hypothetical protein
LSLGNAETSVSNVEIDARGIVFWRYKEGAVVGLTEAEEEVRVVGELVKDLLDGRSLLLIDIRSIASISRAARRLFASDEVSNTGYGVQALALIQGSPVSTFIGNFWQAINRPPHPTRLFTEEAKAVKWLEAFAD